MTVLIDCYECKAKVSDTAASCPHCGALPAESADAGRSLSVVVSDLDMKFSTIFWFLIKAAFAAVPAVVVLYTASTVIGGVLAPFFQWR